MLEFLFYRDRGKFLNGRPWVEQKVSLLAEIEILAKASELNSKDFDKFTAGERNLIAWLKEE